MYNYKYYSFRISKDPYCGDRVLYINQCRKYSIDFTYSFRYTRYMYYNNIDRSFGYMSVYVADEYPSIDIFGTSCYLLL